MGVTDVSSAISSGASWRRAFVRGVAGLTVLGGLGWLAWERSGVRSDAVLSLLGSVSLGYVALAAGAYYGSFPLRASRWSILLAQHLQPPALPSLFELTRWCLYGWLVNCAVPAKLGELYRSFLAQRRSGLPLATVFGTVLVERSADLVVLACLLPLVAWFLGLATDAHVMPLQLVAAALGLTVLGILVSLRRSHRLVQLLPAALHAPFLRLAAGLQLGHRTFFAVTALTVPLWLLEGVRVYAEARALGIALSVPMSFLLAFLAALLTTVPLTPAGIGAVEIGMAGTLMLFGISGEQAVALALFDRLVAYWSVFIVAGVPWLVERLRGS